jgi:hypothetical protein
MPHVTSGNPYIIPIRYAKGIGASFNLSNRCPNRCHYCNSPKHAYGLKIESFLEELHRIAPDEKVTILQANDNHPFEKCNRPNTFRLLDAFKEDQKALPTLRNFFMDPSTLLEKDSGDLWDFLDSLRGDRHQLQFGRECTDKDVASALGRHYHGTPRDQRRLDAEGQAIERAAERLPDSRFKVFYILTPFESERSVSSTVREVESFLKYGNIHTGSNLLWPLPGSPNRVRYKGQYFSFEQVPADVVDKLELITPMELNFWHPSLPAGDFLDYLMGTEVKIFGEPELPNNTSYHLTMMRLIAAMAFGTYKPSSTAESLVGELVDSPAQKPGDIHADFRQRILDLAECVDREQLYDRSVRGKIRFSELVRERFCLWDRVKLQKFRLELECVYQFRRACFAM